MAQLKAQLFASDYSKHIRTYHEAEDGQPVALTEMTLQMYLTIAFNAGADAQYKHSQPVKFISEIS